MLNRIKVYVSTSAAVHVAVAAFIGAVLPVLVPVVEGNALTVSVLKVAVSAGVAAALRALLLLAPTKSAV
jgi:hypothetical protein